MVILAIFVFIFILGILIFVHELGHFVMAKRAGMKVEEFGFGFPPRIFGIRRGETIYSINFIPLGGFVKILGEDGQSAAADPRAFLNGTFWNRFRVLVAGVVMNFIFGWFLIFLGLWLIGTPTQIDETVSMAEARVKNEQFAIVAVQPDSPAAHAGFKAGDVILSIDGQKFNSLDEIVSYTRSRAGNKVVYELGRGKEVFSRDVTPRVNPPEGTGPVGFAPARIATVTYPLPEALKLSFVSFYAKTFGILSAFGMLIKGLFVSGKVIEGLSGPVGIAALTLDITRLGLAYIIQLAATLSINLAIINSVPFPALDGGRMLFLLIEKIRGVRSIKVEQVANLVGFVLLMLLMVVITFRDVGRFSEEFKRLFERIL